MKKSIDQRVISKLLNIGRKNCLCRVLILPVLVIVMLFFHIVAFFQNNVKRCAMIAMTFLSFVSYSSFSFPMFITNADTPAQEQATVTTVTLAVENGVNLDEVDILNDEDVLEDYEDSYEESPHGMELVDTYEASEILESSQNRGEREKKDETAQEEDYSDYEFSADDWRLVLINKQNSIPEDYTFTLGTIKGSMQCDERIIDDLLDMLQAAKEDGVDLIICSPYRDLARQEMLFNRKITRYMNQGMSYMEAYRLSSQAVTVPGASEHQIGLALDIICNEYTSLTEGFGDTEAGIWLAENSYNYGFILRYPKGKEYITGIEYEPWHFRYVGIEAATVITKQGITLEEFWEDLQ